MSKDENRFKERSISLFAGACAGFVEVSIMHPLDLVKTRLQLQGKQSSHVQSEYYTGIGDCIKKMYRNEGVLSFWKGIVPPIAVETPKRAIKFFTFDEYKKIFIFGKAKADTLTYCLAGACAGATESILVTPFEVVKIHLQANRGKMKQVPSSIQMAKQIYATDGLGRNGLYKGLSATIIRAVVFNVAYFGIYHTYIDFSTSRKGTVGFFEKFGAGFVAGTFASVANIPFDVAKSRIQGPQPEAGKVKYKGCVGTLLLIYKEEGWKALYKGLLPKIIRLGPGGGVMFLVNDYVTRYLTNILLK